MYLFTSFSVVLPWEIEQENYTNLDSNLIERTSSYFYDHVLGSTVPMGEIGSINFKNVFFFFLTWVIIYFCIKNGIKQTGYIAYFTVISPYVLLTIF